MHTYAINKGRNAPVNSKVPSDEQKCVTSISQCCYKQDCHKKKN